MTLVSEASHPYSIDKLLPDTSMEPNKFHGSDSILTLCYSV